MRMMTLLKLLIISICISLLAFAFLRFGIIDSLRVMALCTVISIGIVAFYPDVRGIRQGDIVSVVNDSSVPSLIGRSGVASKNGRKSDRIRIMLHSGHEVMGVIESYEGIISPPKIRIVYEERLVE